MTGYMFLPRINHSECRKTSVVLDHRRHHSAADAAPMKKWSLDLVPEGDDRRAPKSESSTPSAVPEEDAPPLLQERGVVGLFLMESAPPRFTGESNSHLREILVLLCRIPQRSGGSCTVATATAAEEDDGDFEEVKAWDCLRRNKSSATTASSVIAARSHSSFITVITTQEEEKDRESAKETERVGMCRFGDAVIDNISLRL